MKITDAIAQEDLDAKTEAYELYIERCIDGYYEFKKNLLIMELVSFDRAKLEIPDVIGILHSESLYNTYTGKLLLKGATIVSFNEYLTETYAKNITDTAKIQFDILLKAIEHMYATRNLVEFVDLTKMSLAEYIEKWKAENSNG